MQGVSRSSNVQVKQIEIFWVSKERDNEKKLRNAASAEERTAFTNIKLNWFFVTV